MRAALAKLAPGVLILGTLAGFSALAWGSDPFRQTPATQAVGRLADTWQVNADRIKLQTKDPTDVYHFSVSYGPGGFSGWHTHPGLIIATVQRGRIVREVGCTSKVYEAGDSFLESDEQPSGQVSNAYTDPGDTDPSHTAVVYATQIVPSGSVRRVEQASPPSC